MTWAVSGGHTHRGHTKGFWILRADLEADVLETNDGGSAAGEKVVRRYSIQRAWSNWQSEEPTLSFRHGLRLQATCYSM